MYIGIDLGTSSVKSILIDENQSIIDSSSVEFSISRPYPLWSEQDPKEWWAGVLQTLKSLSANNPKEMKNLKAIGISGQMHGAVLLDNHDDVLRPAILWNDGRCQAECEELEKLVPDLREITSNIAMAGFTAPKLLWVKKFENDIFKKVNKVLLPKDYIRLKLTGKYVAEMSDASGTLWLDNNKRDWSDKILNAQGLSRDHMPKLIEGSENSGTLLKEFQDLLGCENNVIIAGGGGDNASTAVGMGIVNDDDTLISIGTSGVIFNVSNKVNAHPELTVHSFCHALPKKWHTMVVNLAVSSAINWGVEVLANDRDPNNIIKNLLSLGEQVKAHIPLTPKGFEENNNGLPIFLPYLSGERTPCNDMNAKGMMTGLTLETTTAKMMYAVLEGVAFNFRQSLECLQQAGAKISHIFASGGGTQNLYLMDLIATSMNVELHITEESAVGGALGAGRLAMISTGKNIADVTHKPKVTNIIKPLKNIQTILDTRYNTYQKIYPNVKNLY